MSSVYLPTSDNKPSNSPLPPACSPSVSVLRTDFTGRNSKQGIWTENRHCSLLQMTGFPCPTPGLSRSHDRGPHKRDTCHPPNTSAPIPSTAQSTAAQTQKQLRVCRRVSGRGRGSCPCRCEGTRMSPKSEGNPAICSSPPPPAPFSRVSPGLGCLEAGLTRWPGRCGRAQGST